mgnify:CR=1 FL=1
MESWTTGLTFRKGVWYFSPDFFNLYNKKALSKIKTNAGLQLDERNYNNLWYADDSALIADTDEKLQVLNLGWEPWTNDKLPESISDLN